MSSSYFANTQTNKCQLSHNLVGRGENEQNIWSLTFKSDLLGPPGDINLEKSVHFHSPKHRCLDHEEKHNYELTGQSKSIIFRQMSGETTQSCLTHMCNSWAIKKIWNSAGCRAPRGPSQRKSAHELYLQMSVNFQILQQQRHFIQQARDKPGEKERQTTHVADFSQNENANWSM